METKGVVYFQLWFRWQNISITKTNPGIMSYICVWIEEKHLYQTLQHS